MEHSSPQQHGAYLSPAGILLAGLHLVDRLLSWLVGPMRLTEEERDEAGIYIGEQGYL